MPFRPGRDAGDSPSAPEVLERLKDKFTFYPDGTFTSNRMELERAKRIKNRELRSEAGQQGADKRWGKICHRFANGKKMAKENEYEKENRKDTRGGAGGETAARFAAFWSLYPARRGKKIGKAETEIAFSILSPADQEAVLVAVKNYAASDTLPKDPVRFIRKDYWREWMTPEDKSQPLRAPYHSDREFKRLDAEREAWEKEQKQLQAEREGNL